MPKGRKPTPTNLKILGGIRQDRINPSEPRPPRCCPDPPEWLPRLAKTKWREVAPILDRSRILTEADLDFLACFCLAYSEVRATLRMVRKQGRTVKRGTGGRASHPAIHQLHQAMQQMRHFGDSLGLNPSARSRLHVEPEQPQGVLSRNREA